MFLFSNVVPVGLVGLGDDELESAMEAVRACLLNGVTGDDRRD